MVAVGVWARWSHLAYFGLWFDEGYSAWVASLSPAELVRAVRSDTAPPLYYLALHAWTALAGRSEVALRAPSAACATAALAVMVGVARRLFDDGLARVVAVALVACSSMQVGYAHEARFYSAVSLAGAVDLWLAVELCRRSRASVGWLAAAAVAWAVSLWLNNMMAVYLACLAVAWLALPGPRSAAGRARDVVVVAVAAAVAFAPWVPALLAQRRAIALNYWSAAPDGPALRLVLMRVVGLPESVGAWRWASVAVAGGVVVQLAVARRWRVPAALAAFGLLPVLLTFAYSRQATSIFMDRAFIISSLVLPLAAAVPIELTGPGWTGGRRAAAAVAAVALAGSAVAAWPNRYQPVDHQEDWRAACRFAAAVPTPGRRLVVFNANEGELLWDYYVRGGDYAPSPTLTGTPADYFAAHPAHTLVRVRSPADVAALRAKLADEDAVLFIAAHPWYADPTGRTLSALRAQLWETDRRTFQNVVVFRFARPPADGKRALR